MLAMRNAAAVPYPASWAFLLVLQSACEALRQQHGVKGVSAATCEAVADPKEGPQRARHPVDTSMSRLPPSSGHRIYLLMVDVPTPQSRVHALRRFAITNRALQLQSFAIALHDAA